ncbi:hypothetical protein OIV83_003751 [Microbotryomycetes sp. JL201]|nr:hypothetical protein OIV83_003751 [Microbotryomycetes sp. JL201]
MYTLPIVADTGTLDAAPFLRHFQSAAEHHPLSTSGLLRIARADDGVKAVFGPLLRKRLDGQTVCLMDLYSTLVSTFFWITPGHGGRAQVVPQVLSGGFSRNMLIGPSRSSLKWSSAIERLENGQAPFPILTAVRHERPWRTFPSLLDEKREQISNLAWWQWFEMNPIEIGSAELEGWLATTSFGTHFEGGQSSGGRDELSIGLLLGCTTAAPAAPLSAILGGIWRRLPKSRLGQGIRRWIRRSSFLIGEHLMNKIDNLNPIHASECYELGCGAKAELSISARVLDAVPVHAKQGKEGLVYNERHQSQAWKPVTIVYLPLLPNAVNPEYDPATAAFSSTHNLVWTHDQVESLRKTARANVDDSIEIIRDVVRQAYLRRRRERLASESVIDKARQNVCQSSPATKVYVRQRIIDDDGRVDPAKLNGLRPWMTD